MQFVAKSKFVRKSPYKIRPLADFIRGKNVKTAIDWLYANETQRVTPLKKVLESAVANAKNLKNAKPENLYIKDLRVDQGPIFRYYKAGAMGRAEILRKRFSHISVTLEDKQKEV
ncbi:MAG: 50S ribosomal protein L22 [Candidatus Babeliales bacterium]